MQNVLYTKVYNILKITFLGSPKSNFGLLITQGEVSLAPHGFVYPPFAQRPCKNMPIRGAGEGHSPLWRIPKKVTFSMLYTGVYNTL